MFLDLPGEQWYARPGARRAVLCVSLALSPVSAMLKFWNPTHWVRKSRPGTDTLKTKVMLLCTCVLFGASVVLRKESECSS